MPTADPAAPAQEMNMPDVCHPTCPACSAVPETEPVLRSRRWDVVECPACGHVFAGGMRGECSSANVHFEETDYLSWRDRFARELRSRAARRARFILSTTGAGPGKILELGCSTGELLSEFARRGWDACGVDLSAGAIEAARRRDPEINVFHGTQARFLEGDDPRTFDLIAACHVIEHVADLDEFVGDCRQLCAPGGFLVLFVPNWGSWARKLLGDCWPDFMPEHVQYFNPASARAMLERHGFTIRHIRTAGSSWPWLGGLARRLKGLRNDAAIGKAAPRAVPGGGRMRILKVGDVLMSPVFLLERAFSGGNELIIFARSSACT